MQAPLLFGAPSKEIAVLLRSDLVSDEEAPTGAWLGRGLRLGLAQQIDADRHMKVRTVRSHVLIE